ncbi:MAG: peptide ABC transporter substrate-binding protein, partial [Planctomycetota bacterium]
MLKLLMPLVLLAIVIGLVVVADRPRPRADFVFHNGQDVATLDLQKMSWSMDLRAARIVFEGLARNDAFSPGFEPIPAAAEAWEISPDGKTYTFRIREEARWSNGEPVRAHDFVYSWRRALLPDTAADYFKLFTIIEGAKPFYDWRTRALEAFAAGESDYATGDELWAATEARFNETVGLRAIDDKTLEVRLIRPVPYFLDLMAFAVFYPVYPPLVEQYDVLDPAGSGRIVSKPGWTKPPHIVSNGPFMLTEWRFKRDMTFEQNPHWWDRDSLDVRTMQAITINDPNAQVLAYQTGAVDYLADVTAAFRREMFAQKQTFLDEHAEQVAELRAQGLDQFEIDRRLPDDPRKHTHVVSAFGTYWYNFNCLPNLLDGRPNPFADARVRRAFAMTIDKQTIAEKVRGMGEPVARSLVPPGSIPGYTPPAGLKCISDGKTDAEREAIAAEARALLAEAGWPNPSEFPVVD